jgi:hypothetical protein
LRSCKTAREFALYMASSEDRGRKAGERFHQQMMARDPISAKIFGKIAEEEVEHIALASQFFDYVPGRGYADPIRPDACTSGPPWNRVPHRGPEV